MTNWRNGSPRARPSACPPSRSKAMPTVHRIRSPSSYAKKFTGRYEHRHIEGGIGHNLPQEDPKAFVQAIIDVDGA